MVSILSGRELFKEFKELGFKVHFLSKDHSDDKYFKGIIRGVILHGVYYLDDGDGIKSSLLITPSRLLCKDKDVVPSSIFHVDNGKIELFVTKDVFIDTKKDYDNIIKSLKYEYVSGVNNIVNGDDEYYIKDYM